MRLQNDEREVKFLVGKLETLVGQFFSTGEAHAPPVKHLKMPCYMGHIKKYYDPLYTTATAKKSCRSKMPYMISSQLVTDGVSLSVSKSKLVNSSLIFVIPAKARDYGITGVGLSVCLFVCLFVK